MDEIYVENLPMMYEDPLQKESNFTKININGPDVKCECSVNTTNLLNNNSNLGFLNFYTNFMFINIIINICCFLILWALLSRLCKSFPQACYITILIFFIFCFFSY
jgi:hypothetical protein